MQKLTKIFLIFMLLTANYCMLSTAQAAVPRLINYQGKLTDPAGAPLNGSYNLTFRIYDAETAGNMLWQETQNGVVVQKGVFSILLGSVTALNIPFDKQYYLAIQVGSDPEMSPRQKITSAAYAIKSEKAETLTMPAQQGDILYFDGSNWTNLAAGTPGQYLRTQGPGINPVWSNGYMNMQVFTSSGTFIKPTGVSKVFVEVIGGGASGSRAMSGVSAVTAAAGGGAGGYAAKICTLTGDVTVTVGAGGVGSTTTSNDGGASSFGSFCSASGGIVTEMGKRGGSGSGGDMNITGQSGEEAISGTTSNGAAYQRSGSGGSAIYGLGGAGIFYAGGIDGNPGTGYGAGGSGGYSWGTTSRAGGSGAGGVVIVRW